MKKLVCALLALMLALGCGAALAENKSDVFGVWRGEGNNTYSDIDVTLTLNADFTGSYDCVYASGAREQLDFTYEFDDAVFTITPVGNTMNIDKMYGAYTINGDEMTLEITVSFGEASAHNLTYTIKLYRVVDAAPVEIPGEWTGSAYNGMLQIDLALNEDGSGSYAATYANGLSEKLEFVYIFGDTTFAMIPSPNALGVTLFYGEYAQTGAEMSLKINVFSGSDSADNFSYEATLTKQ